MAYAGATVRVISRVKGYDGEPITNLDGVDITLDIFDHEKAHFAGPFAMAWNAAKSYWFYDWDTEAAGAVKGTYLAKVEAEGSTKKTWKVGRLPLKQSPV